MRGIIAVIAVWLGMAAALANTPAQEAAFVQSANLNRSGNPAEAYLQLKALENAGYRNREIDFEIGWSLLGLGRAGACVLRLERYERAAPGRALTSELLGRCYLIERAWDQAEAKLREASARDPGAKARVDLLLTRVQFGRGERKAAAATFSGLVTGESELGRAVRDSQAALARLAPQRDTGLKLTASLALGYNSNVIGLGNTSPLPADITGKSSLFARTGVGISNSMQLDAQTRGSIGYGLQLERYTETHAANTDDHYAYAEITRRMSERFGLSLRGSLQITQIEGTHFRATPAVRAGALYQFTPNSVTQAAYQFSAPEYERAAAPVFNRSGEAHAFLLNHVMRVPNTPWAGTVGYSHVENRTEGRDFRSKANAVTAALRYSFTGRNDLTVGATYGRDRYAYPNSLSPTGAARRDIPRSAFLQLDGPLSEALRYYVQLQASRSHSNLAFYNYRQHSVVGGLAYEF